LLTFILLDELRHARKADEEFDPDYNYVYDIVSIGTNWYFILHSTEGIYNTSRSGISLTEDALENPIELLKECEEDF
jgi:hypothetical protein